MDNNINFKGAFLLQQPTKNIQKKILPTLGKHRQIFNNFNTNGDVLYITRKGCDKNVAEFLTHHRTAFKYYTDLSTKSGFDNEFYDKAKQILDSYKSTIITKRSELIDHFKFNRIKLPFSTKRNANPIELSVKALGLDNIKNTIKKKNGYSEVFDTDGNLLARISGPGQYGISFAFHYACSQKPNDTISRYALRGGQIIFKYTGESGRTQFLKNYNRAVKANKQINAAIT